MQITSQTVNVTVPKEVKEYTLTLDQREAELLHMLLGPQNTKFYRDLANENSPEQPCSAEEGEFFYQLFSKLDNEIY